ncbi:hypothetical protein B0J17DRAFT_684162 [Rhizoctonia solani]|nr:hypothetical protein B0J17DRAFT_684162 [Rhizoctonia solani]
MSDPTSGNHHPQYQRTMIGPTPSGYRQRTQQHQPSQGEMEATFHAYLHQDVPSSTVPSAAHSQSQHPVSGVSTLDSGNFGVFEPVPGANRPFTNFSSILPNQSAPQTHQQVPGDFIPGAGAGTNEWYQQQQQRNYTIRSDHSESSAAQLSSPVRDAGGQQAFNYPTSNPNPNVFTSTAGHLYYPNRGSSGSDFPSSSDQFTSPIAGPLSPDKNYMSSPEQIQFAHPTQSMYATAGQASLFDGQAYNGGQTGPFRQSGPSPARKPTTQSNLSPTRMTGQQGGGFNTTWNTVESTNAIAPGGGSAGSHSSGGGNNGAPPYATSSGGFSAHSGNSQVRPGPNIPRQSRPGAPVGRSLSNGSRLAHRATQSMKLLAPPSHAGHSGKRQRQEEPEEVDDSDGYDEPQDVPTGRRAGASKRLPGACSNCKRLKMKCVFDEGDICQRCKHTNKPCIVEGRKRREGPNKRELMMREIASKDQLIDSLLRQIHNPAMRTPINWPPTVPAPQQSANNDRPPDRDVLAWIESIRQHKPPTPTGSIDAGSAHQAQVQVQAQAPGHIRAVSEPLARPASEHPDDDAVSFGESASNVKDKDADRPRTPIELRQDSVELGETLHSIPDGTSPVGLIAKLSLRANRDKRGSDAGMTGDAEEEDKWVGVGNMTYFEAGPSANPELRRMIIERQMPPEILTHGIIKPKEVEILFKIFFEQLNPFIAILDPNMHTPAFVFGRCPFLFTAICAISSRYYTKRPELYTIAMHFAKQSAATALIDGWKSVELVQAYILMSVYPVPARRWEEDRTWLYLGLAIRMATDLNLHLPWQGKATGEAHEREILNRTRTWLICFNLDRSGATQFGRPPTIREDYIVRKSGDWYKRSKFNLPLDIHLTGYTRLLRIVARFLASVYSDSNSPTALNKNADFLTLCTQTDEELTAFENETKEQFEKESDHNDSACRYRCDLLPFLSNYSRVVIFSFGHQQAFQRGLEKGKIFFDKCYKAACEVVRIAIEILAPSGRLRYSPDGHFVFLSFAAAFLLKMLRPQFAPACERSQSQHIISLVTRLTEVLSSNDVSIDDRHSPRLYSRFLSGLIQKHTQGNMILAAPSNANANGSAGAPGGSVPGPSGTQDKGKGPANGGSRPSNPSISGSHKSAPATDAGLMHESPPSAPVPLPSEAEEARDHMGMAPPMRMKSPPIVIRPPTIDQGMHDPPRLNGHQRSLSDGQQPASNNIMGGYVTVEPSGDTVSSMASTTQGETTITDVTGDEMDFEDSHDMLAAMAALQDPQWWDTSLLPGWNANFADDGSNSSSEMRHWYTANQQQQQQNAMPMMNHMPNLIVPGLDYTQGMQMNQQEMGMDHMMAGYGYR